MRQFLCFQFYHHKATQQAVIKYKVGKELVVLNEYAFLASHKCETASKFKQEFLQMSYQCLFQALSSP